MNDLAQENFNRPVREGTWIPKEENSTKLEQFKSTSLVSMEGKIFSVPSRVMTDYADTSAQKGGIP